MLLVEPASAVSLFTAMSAVFEAIGRGLICLDAQFRILHASAGLDRVLGAGTAGALSGLPVAEVFDPALFGPGGSLRQALERGERREGWGAELRRPQGGRVWLSITAAPFAAERLPGCDPHVAYLLVVRPSEEDAEAGGGAPTLFAGMVARSPSMLRIFRLIEQLHESEATVLIEGESGTGKELVARAIHHHSPRRASPFVAVNCGALPTELLESELFGHVRGAFTGAVRDRVGRFELAGAGTLFLDEVGELPLPLQVKLLRVLQERTFERVGESRSVRSEARVIAATNLDLKRARTEGRFREDLYYRLRVVPIEIPPLRQRREDIEPVARHLLSRLNARHGRAVRLDPGALRLLVAYDWPGNVRELENALELGIALCQGQTIHAGDLPTEVQGEQGPWGGTPAPGTPRAQLESALQATRWNREAAARRLGVSRTTLWRRMREAGLVGLG